MCKSSKMYQFAQVILLSLVFSGIGLAQGTGTITGEVTDAAEASVPDAEVTLTHVATGLVRTVTTNETGRFVAVSLPIGKYRIEATLSGFKKYVQVGIVLNQEDHLSVPITLELGQVAESVTVTGDAVMVQTESSEVSGVITENQISELAVNGRNFLALMQVVPGVMSTAGDRLEFGLFFQTQALQINGLPGTYANMNLDGTQNTNPGCYCVVKIYPSMEAIAEFRVLAGAYSAEHGFSPGAQIITTTKGGTSEFHGSVYEFLRNDALDARNFFVSDVSPLRLNQFGFTVGGPLHIPGKYNTSKTKDFFFYSEEWRKERRAFVQSTAVAPQALRNGDFTGTGVTIIDPATGLAFGDQSNIGSLPGESPIDPNSVLLMNQMFPLPNEVVAGRFNNFVNPASPVNDTRQDLIRWDHNFNDNHQMMIKYINEETLLANPSVQWSPTTVPTINTLQRTPANLLSGRYIFTISPTLLNEFSVAWSNQNVQAELEGAFTRPAGLTIPQIFGSEDKVPGLTFAGGWAGADLIFFPWFNNAHDLIIQNKVFKQVGNHTLKFGIYLMRAWQFEDTQPINLGGTFNFTGQFSGHPIADFLLGNAATYKEANGQPRGDHTLWNYEGFVQDDWKVTPRLTANLGVRYFYLAPTTEIQDRYSNFVPSAFDPANAPVFLDPVTGQLDSAIPFDSLNGLVRAGEGGTPRGVLPGNVGSRLLPRVGLAYDLFGNGKTALRAGVGMGLRRTARGESVHRWLENPPFVTTASVSGGTTPLMQDPGGGASPLFPGRVVLALDEHIGTTIAQWSIGIQHQLDANTIIDVGYVASRTWREPVGRQLNQPLRFTDPLTNQQFDFNPRINVADLALDTFRPFQGWTGIRILEPRGRTWYDALQMGLRRRFTQGLSFSVNYAWSKTLAYGGGGLGFGANLQDGLRHPEVEKGLAIQDRPHNLSANWIWELPFLKNQRGALGKIAGGWQVSGISIIRSGVTLRPSLGGVSNPGLANRPDLVGSVGANPGTLSEWFDISPFVQPADGFFGNMPIGIIRGPGDIKFDLSTFKNHRIGETVNVQFRAEFFNIFNHTNFEGVGTGLGAANFGVVTSARDPRIIQFGLRIVF